MSHEDNAERHEKHSKSSDKEGMDIDFSGLKGFFKSKAFYGILLALMILIPIILTIYIRLLPEQMPATDEWAQNSVYNYYTNSISQQVSAQYPNLPTAQKQKLIGEQFNQFKEANKDALDQSIQQTSEYFKTGFQYQENNNTYTLLGDLDSYFYLRYARNYLDKGTICDQIVEGKCIDDHMLAPEGAGAEPSMHPLGTVYLYKILHAFDKKINLMQAAFLLPLFIAIIAAVAAFFIGRLLMNDVAGFFASMFVALSPLFITRTLGSDTDVWNVMFPLVIILIFLYAFESKSIWKRIGLTALTGFVMGMFSFAWSSGWWYIFDFMVAAVIVYMLFELIKGYINKRKRNATRIVSDELKNSGITLGVMIISALIFVSLFTSFSIFTSAATAPISMLTELKAAAHANLWPNVYTTVAELNEANISTIVSQVSFGMKMLFALALLGIIATLVRREPKFRDYIIMGLAAVIYLFLISTNALGMNAYLYLILLILPVAVASIMLLNDTESAVDVKMAFILTIWFVGMIFSSIKGVRFVLLLTPAFGIAIGVAIGYIYQYFSRVFHEDLKLNIYVSRTIIFLVLCILLIAPVQAGISAGKSYMPSMTSGWWDSLTKIREGSAPDAIINSWWDFGHWFKYVADRRVTLDGASQNHPNAHWLGKILETNNETEAIGVLRMLDCGSNNAFEEVNKRYNDTEISENIISEIIVLDKDGASRYLGEKGFSNAEIEKILSLTHCNPPEDYFITSEDMVGKAGVWAHFGLWSFDKAYIINNLRNEPMDKAVKAMQDRWGYTEDEAVKIYYDVQALTSDSEMNSWIAPWPSYATDRLLPCTNTPGDIVYCDLNIGIGGNGQQNIVLQRAAINLSHPEMSQVLLGIYDASTNAKLGENVATWNKVVVAKDDLTTYNIENSTLNLGFLLNIDTSGNTTTYSAVVSDPALIDSTFTRLFYIEGKGTKHFKKFSDTTDITGVRIIVWKVEW